MKKLLLIIVSLTYIASNALATEGPPLIGCWVYPIQFGEYQYCYCSNHTYSYTAMSMFGTVSEKEIGTWDMEWEQLKQHITKRYVNETWYEVSHKYNCSYAIKESVNKVYLDTSCRPEGSSSSPIEVTTFKFKNDC